MRRCVVPVLLERLRHLARNGADGEYIEIRKQHALPGAEVFIPDVTATDDRRFGIGGKRLVVHAPIQAAKVAEVAERLEPAVRERIEQPNLDIVVAIQRSDRRVEPRDAVVVEQKPHAHATLGGTPQVLEQQVARRIAVPDVVLHVERPLGSAREQAACREGLLCDREWIDAAGVGAWQPRLRASPGSASGLRYRARWHLVPHCACGGS